MKTGMKRTLCGVLAALTVLCSVPMTVFASEAGKVLSSSGAYRRFPDAGVSERTRGQNVFYFGSTNMTVSEKSADSYIMKICRGGNGDSEASVTVKFGDCSASYGENYTLSTLGEGEELIVNGNGFSVVDFMIENADSFTEYSSEEVAESEREMLTRLTENKNADVYDLNGDLISSIELTEKENKGIASVDGASYELGVGASTDKKDLDYNMSDVTAAAQVVLTFAKNEFIKEILVTPLYSQEAQGDATVEVALDNPSAGMYLPNEDYVSVLTVIDEDEVSPAVLSIVDSSVSADGDTVSITVTREGAINNNVSAVIYTTAVSAVEGEDYQGVDALLYFPMGVLRRTVELKLNHRYAKEQKQFRVSLGKPVGATVDNGTCTVTILPDPTLTEGAMDGIRPKMMLSAVLEEKGKDEEYYNIESVPHTEHNKAWLTGAASFYCDNTGDDCPYDTYCGISFDIPRYYYDGIEIRWKQSRKFTTYGYTRIESHDSVTGSWSDMYKKDTGDFSWCNDSYSIKTAAADKIRVGIKTTSWYGKKLTVEGIRMYHTRYNVNLIQADSLSYRGVSQAEEEKYVETYILGESPEKKSTKVYSGERITVTEPSGHNYAVITGILITDKHGNKICDVKDIDPDAVQITNGTAVTLTLTAKLLNAIGDGIEFTTYKDGINRQEGEIYVKPVFGYVDSQVVLSYLTKEKAYFSGFGAILGYYYAVKMHVGDVVRFTQAGSTYISHDEFILATGIDDPRYVPVGFDAECYPSADLGVSPDASIGAKYLNGEASIVISSPKVVLYPRVAESDNCLTVRVAKSLVDGGKFDTSVGIFLYPRTDLGDWYSYRISDPGSTLSQGTFFALSAEPSDGKTVSNWTIGSESGVFSGNVLYLLTKAYAQENTVYLTLPREVDGRQAAVETTVTGIVYNDDRSIVSGLKTGYLIPASGAAVAAGDVTAVADSADGSFVLDDVRVTPDTTLRLVVYHNNSVFLKDIRINGDGKPSASTVITLSSGRGNTAYVKSVYFRLGDQPADLGCAVVMNGKKLEMIATVCSDNTYEYNGTKKQEHVKEVWFEVLDGNTLEVKSSYKARKTSEDTLTPSDVTQVAKSSTWQADIPVFSPESEDSFTYGDLFYVYIVTDRSDYSDISDSMRETAYAAVPTGYGIGAGGDYKAKTFAFEAPVSASALMGGGEEGSGGKKSFAKLPIIGNLNLTSLVVGKIKFGNPGSDDIEEMHKVDPEYEDSELEPGEHISDYEPATQKSYAVKINVSTQTLADGRLRLNVGVVVTLGNNQKKRNLANPFTNLVSAYDMLSGAYTAAHSEDEAEAQSGQAQADAMKTNLSGLQLSFTASFGVYFDFVIVEEGGDLSEFHFVGIGGYLGFTGNLTFVQYYIIPIVFIPAYIGFSASASLMGYIGADKDITQYLEDGITYDDVMAQDEISVNKGFDFNCDASFKANVTGFAGIGVCNVVGLRLNLSLGCKVEYVHRLPEWYPNIGCDWGFSASLSVGGQLDLLFASIPFNGLSVPLTDQGFAKYYAALNRAQKMVGIVNDDSNKEGMLADSTLKAYYDACVSDIENKNASTTKLDKDAENLYDYLYDHSELVHDDLKSTIFMKYHTDSDIYKLMATKDSPEYSVKEQVDSSWNANIVMPQAGYRTINTTMLVRNSYDNPSCQLITLDDGRIALFFLADPCITTEDGSRPEWSGEGQTSVLVYSVLNDNIWSRPRAVEENATNDFYPNAVLCGEKIMLSWVSSDPTEVNGDETPYGKRDVIDSFTSMEIFSAMYDISSDSVTEIEQLTDDEFTDLYPQGVYDAETGDRAVYYIKTAVDTEADIKDINLTDFVSFYSDRTYSMVCYMLYDSDFDETTGTDGAGSGCWLKNYYFEEEMEPGVDPEDYLAEQGQRYLPSVLEIMKSQGLVPSDTEVLEFTVNDYVDGEIVEKTEYIDPPVTDLAVCSGYNGLAVYAYTVDTDMDLNTNSDTELFLQIYDFRTHKTYHPIRLTDDSVAQGRPQLLRVSGTTYLFWLYNDSVVEYIDISELVRDYVDADGRVVDKYYINSSGDIYYIDDVGVYRITADGRSYVTKETLDTLTLCEYEMIPSVVNSTVPIYGRENASVGDFRAVMDEELNIYILWTQIVPDDNVELNDVPVTEVYATALIREKDTENNEAAWSDPYRLTQTGHNVDDVEGAVTGDGRLVLTYNEYTMEYIGDSEEFLLNAKLNDDGTLTGDPYRVGPTNLMISTLGKVGSMEAESIKLSDMTPTDGETVSVTAVITNSGLTTAKNGYSVSFCETRTVEGVDRTGRTIYNYSTNEPIVPGDSETLIFDWTAPADCSGLRISAVVRENGYSIPSTKHSEYLAVSPEYSVVSNGITQTGSQFVAEYTVTNHGNAPASEKDRVILRFDALYQSYEKYGLDTDVLAEVPLDGLAAGESKTFATTVTVPACVFDYIGFDQLDIEVTDGDGNVLASDNAALVLKAPLSLSYNGGNDIEIYEGIIVKPETDLGNRWVGRYTKLLYSVGDENVAKVDTDGRLVGVGGGTTTVTVTAVPSGVQTSVNVTVNGGSKKTPRIIPTIPLTDGGEEDAFHGDEPEIGDAEVTLPFTDAVESDWFYGDVKWAYENKVMNGVAPTLFAPDALMTRAMLVTVLYRISGSPADAARSEFTDVSDGDWYADAVNWAAEQGIVLGYGDGRFGPNDIMTREQFVTVLGRYAALILNVTAQADGDALAGFADADDVSDWARSAVEWAVGNALLIGDGELLRPHGGTTRAQAAAIIRRFYENIISK